MAASAILAIKILADASKANSALADSEQKTSKWASGLGTASKVAMVGLAAVGAVMVSGVKAAADDAQQQAILATALKKSAGATDAQVASTEDWITKTAQATGVADDQLRPALGNLARATGSVSESQKAMSLALDISAATGKDLDSVSAALAKGYAGQTTAIGRLVPGLDKATLASGDMAQVSAMLADKVGGSAAAAADTAAGQYKILTNNLAETKEGIGAALLPIVTELATHLASLAKIVQDNTGTVTILLGVIAALAAVIVTANYAVKAYNIVTAISTGLTATNSAEVKGNTAATAAYAIKQGVVRVATLAWSAAQWLLNAALTANPIGLVVLAIALLVAGLVLAYNKSETFRNIVNAAFGAVLAFVKNVVGWIHDNLGGFFSAAAAAAGAAISKLGDVISSVMRGARAVIQPIIDLIENIMSLVGKAASAIKSLPHPKLPDLNPFSAAPSTSAATGVAYRGVARAPAAARGTSSSGGLVVNVNGALDPEGVARQIQRILGAHDVRVGRAAVAR